MKLKASYEQTLAQSYARRGGPWDLPSLATFFDRPIADAWSVRDGELSVDGSTITAMARSLAPRRWA